MPLEPRKQARRGHTACLRLHSQTSARAQRGAAGCRVLLVTVWPQGSVARTLATLGSPTVTLEGLVDGLGCPHAGQCCFPHTGFVFPACVLAPSPAKARLTSNVLKKERERVSESFPDRSCCRRWASATGALQGDLPVPAAVHGPPWLPCRWAAERSTERRVRTQTVLLCPRDRAMPGRA